MSISAYLAWASWQSGPILGCSGDGLIDCDHVLSTRWSSWLGLPVSLLGMMIYVGILAVCWSATRGPLGWAATALLTFSLLAAGSAIWFISIQAVILKSFCLYCLGVHTCGLSIAMITLLSIRSSSSEDDYGQMRALLGVAEPTAEALPDSRSSFHPLIATAIASLGLAVLMAGQLLHKPKTLVMDLAFESEPLALEEEAEDTLTDSTTEEPSTENSIAEDPPTEEMSTEESTVEDPIADDPIFEDPVADDLFADDLFAEEDQESEKLLLEEQKPQADEQQPESLATSRRIQPKGLQKAIDPSDYPILGNPKATFVFVEMMDYTCKHCRHLHHFLLMSLDRYGDQMAIVVQHVPLHSDCNPNVIQDKPANRNSCGYAKLAIGVWKLEPSKFPEFHDWLMESEKPPPIIEARRRAVRLAGVEVLVNESLLEDTNKRISQQCEVLNRIKGGLPALLTERGIVRGIPTDEKEWFGFLEKGFAVKPILSDTEKKEEKESPLTDQSIAEELGF